MTHVRLALDDGGDAFPQQRMVVDAQELEFARDSLIDSGSIRGCLFHDVSRTRPATKPTTSAAGVVLETRSARDAKLDLGAGADSAPARLSPRADRAPRARACPSSPQWPSRPVRSTSASMPRPSSRTSDAKRPAGVFELDLDAAGAPRAEKRSRAPRGRCGRLRRG